MRVSSRTKASQYTQPLEASDVHTKDGGLTD